MGKRTKREQRKTAREIAAKNETARKAELRRAEIRAIRCPACGAAEVAKFGYGLPRFTPELLADLDSDLVILAGCDFSEDDPIWICKDCKHTWGRLGDLLKGRK